MKSKKLISLLAAAAMTMSLASPAMAAKVQIAATDATYDFNDGSTTGWSGENISNVDGKIKTTAHWDMQVFDLPDVSTGTVTASVEVDVSNITANGESEGAINLVWANSDGTMQASTGLHLLLDTDTSKMYARPWGNPDWGKFGDSIDKNQVYTVEAKINFDTGAVDLKIKDSTGAVKIEQSRTGYTGDLGCFKMYTRGEGYILLDNIKISNQKVTEVESSAGVPATSYYTASNDFEDGTKDGWSGGTVVGSLKLTGTNEKYTYTYPEQTSGTVTSSIDIDLSNVVAADNSFLNIGWTSADGIDGSAKGGFVFKMNADNNGFYVQGHDGAEDATQSLSLDAVYTMSLSADYEFVELNMTLKNKATGTTVATYTDDFTASLSKLEMYVRCAEGSYLLLDNFVLNGIVSTDSLYHTETDDFEDGTKDGWSGGQTAGKLKLDGANNIYTYTYEEISEGTVTSSVDLDFSNVKSTDPNDQDHFLTVAWADNGSPNDGDFGRIYFTMDASGNLKARKCSNWSYSDVLDKTKVYTLSMNYDLSTKAMVLNLTEKGSSAVLVTDTQTVNGPISYFDLQVLCKDGGYILVDNFELTGTMTSYGDYTYIEKNFDAGTDGWSGGTTQDGKLKLDGVGSYYFCDYGAWIGGDFRASYDVDFSNVAADSGGEGSVFFKSSLTNNTIDTDGACRLGWIFNFNDDTHATWWPMQIPNWTPYDTQANSKSDVYTVTYNKVSSSDNVTVKIINKATGAEVVSQDQWVGGNTVKRLDMWVRCADGSYVLLDNFVITTAPEGFVPTVTENTITSNFDDGTATGWSGGTLVGGLYINAGEQYRALGTLKSGYTYRSSVDFSLEPSTSTGYLGRLGWTGDDGVNDTPRPTYWFKGNGDGTTFKCEVMNPWDVYPTELASLKFGKTYTMSAVINVDGKTVDVSIAEKGGAPLYTANFTDMDTTALTRFTYWKDASDILLDNFTITDRPEGELPETIETAITSNFDDGTKDGWSGGTVAGGLKIDSGEQYRTLGTLESGKKYRSSVDFSLEPSTSTDYIGRLGWTGDGGANAEPRAMYWFKGNGDGETFKCEWIQEWSTYPTELASLKFGTTYTMSAEIDVDGKVAYVSIAEKGGAALWRGHFDMATPVTRFTYLKDSSTVILDNFVVTNEPERPSSDVYANNFNDGNLNNLGSNYGPEAITVANNNGQVQLNGTNPYFFDIPDCTTGIIESSVEVDLANANTTHVDGAYAVGVFWMGQANYDTGNRIGYRLIADTDGTMKYGWIQETIGNWDGEALPEGVTKVKVKAVIDLDKDTARVSLTKMDDVEIVSHTMACSFDVTHIGGYSRCAGDSYVLLDNISVAASGAPSVVGAVFNGADGSTRLSEISALKTSPYAENVVLTFDKNISGYKVDEYVKVKDADGNTVNTSVVLDGKTVTLGLDKVLDAESTYTVEISNELYAENGVQTGLNVVYPFKTGTADAVGNIVSVKDASDTAITTAAALNAASDVIVNCTIKNGTGNAGEYALIIAYCNADGEVVDVDMREFSLDASYNDIELTSTKNAQNASAVTAKVFMWSGFGKFVPICQELSLN